MIALFGPFHHLGGFSLFWVALPYKLRFLYNDNTTAGFARFEGMLP